MPRNRRITAPAAFSLIELVLALGLCATGVVTALGLLTAAARDVGAAGVADAARNLRGAIESELLHVGYDGAVAALVVEGSPVQEAGAWFASRDGRALGPAGRVPASDRFFAVVLERDPDLSPSAADGSAGFVAFQVRIEWPHRRPDGVVVAASRRSVLRFSCAIAR